jgi:phosphoribosyl-AMP cyclohydrolase
MNSLEEGLQLKIDFQKIEKVVTCGEDLVPVVVQDVLSKEVLVVAYANQLSLDYTLQNQVAAFWSSSRNELWIKGATSGEFLKLVEVRVNCEQNSLLYLVEITSLGACHTKEKNGNPRTSCYYRKINNNGELAFL